VSQLQAVLAALQGSSKPVIYYGGGCQDAKEELREFAYKTGIPVTSTLMVCPAASGAPLVCSVCEGVDMHTSMRELSIINHLRFAARLSIFRP
jgi:glyoxylate carboligase